MLNMLYKTFALLLIFVLVSVLSYRFGYIFWKERSYKRIHPTRNTASIKSAKPNSLGSMDSVPSSGSVSSFYEYTTDHKCRVIDYARLPKDDFPCVRLQVDKSPYICVYNRSNEDQYVSHSIITTGTWETDLVNMIVVLLKSDPGLAFIDIGTNIGQFALVAASMGRNVVAVDAFRRHTLMLGRAVVMNGFQDRVKIVHNALSHTYRNVSLVGYQGNPGMTRVKTKFSAGKPVGETVPTILMDDLVHVVDFRRAIMKIDIEGHEARALSHSTQLFTKVDIPVIFMEWWGGIYNRDGEGAFVRNVISFFKIQKYTAYNQKFKMLDFDKWHQWPNQIILKRQI